MLLSINDLQMQAVAIIVLYRKNKKCLLPIHMSDNSWFEIRINKTYYTDHAHATDQFQL